MSIRRLLGRTVETAIKLPFAMAWDVASLGNMGDGASTSKVLREHNAKKQIDDILDIMDKAREMRK